MKKYEKPMITEEMIPVTDTAIASGSDCKTCIAYAPSLGKPAGWDGKIGSDQYSCSDSETDTFCW